MPSSSETAGGSVSFVTAPCTKFEENPRHTKVSVRRCGCLSSVRASISAKLEAKAQSSFDLTIIAQTPQLNVHRRTILWCA